METGPQTSGDAQVMPPPAARARRPLRWIAGSLLGLAVLTGFGVLRAFRVADATIAEHRARLPAERAALLAGRRERPALVDPAIPGDAAEILEAFFAAYAAVPPRDRSWMPPPLESSASLKAQDAILAAHPEPVLVLTPLLRVPRDPVPILEPDELTRGRWWAAAQWLGIAVERAIARADGEASLRLSLLQVVYAHECERLGSRDDRQGALSYEWDGSQGLAEALTIGTIGREEAHRLGVALDRLESSRTPVSEVLAVERWSRRREVVETDVEPPGRGEYFGEPGWRRLWSWRLYRAEYLVHLDAALDRMGAAVALADRDARGAMLEATSARVNDLVWLQHDLSWWRSWILDRERTRASNLVVRVALAVAEASARRGKLPGSLAELVPDLLPAVPTDPWSGTPLRYADGKVWSVGPDGKDDGGAPLAKPGSVYSVGDIVARVPAPR